jgi:peptidoglycan/LPS O-acetylase OafA/YrhL
MVKNEIRPLTGIRGIAALWVVLLHYKIDLAALIPQINHFSPLIDKGGMGVDIFFVLSGFVISMVYKIEKRDVNIYNTGEFLINRLARIYPDYVFCFGMLFVIVSGDALIGDHLGKIKHATSFSDYPINGIFWHVTMLQSWPVIPAKWDNWNTPAWSVSAEWFAYIFIFPLSVWICKNKILRKNPAFIVFLTLFLFILLSDFSFRFGHKTYNLFRVSSEYLAGSITYIYWLQKRDLIKKYASYLDLVVILFIFVIWFENLTPISNYIIILLIPVIIILLTEESSFTSKILATKQIRYMGYISYALYLVHAIVQRLLHVLFPVHKFQNSEFYIRLFFMMVYLIAPVLFAVAIYHLVEEPSRLTIRRYFYKKPLTNKS